VLGLAGALVVAAALGKLACAFGVLDRRARRLPVALGMIPRGEVGLIFANVGLTLVVAGRPVVDSGTYSAVVVMVFVTTMMTPALLAWSFRRH
jgi:Kef-type K+ transport system membrane component KefB